MAFADEKKKLATKRHVLARVCPGRDVTSLVSLISGNNYSYQFDQIPHKIEYNGVELTRVLVSNGDESNLSSDEWLYNTSTKTVYVNPGEVITPASDTMVLFYYLFYTNADTDLIKPLDASSGDDVRWSARVMKSPSTTQSVVNVVTTARLTSRASDLVIANLDNDFNKFLTEDDSFANKECKVWTFINGESTVSFNGVITRINVGKDRVSFALNDRFSLTLSEPMYFGDDPSDIIGNTSTYPDIRAADINKPVPIIFGIRSPTDYDRGVVGFTLGGSGDPATIYAPDMKVSHRMRGLNVDQGSAVNDNRDWLLCRYDKDIDLYSKSSGFPTPASLSTTDTLSNPSTAAGVVRREKFFTFSSQTTVFEPGMHIKYNSPTSTGRNGVVTGVQQRSVSNETLVVFLTDDPENATQSTSLSITSIEATPWVLISQGGTVAWPVPDVDFTTSETTLNNTKLLKLSFVDDFEEECFVSHGLSVPRTDKFSSTTLGVDPRAIQELTLEDNLLYSIRLEDSASFSHADILGDMLANAGFTNNAASFTAAKSALSSDTYFTVPFVGRSNELGTLKEYVEAIIQSTVAAIYYSPVDDEIFYKLLEAPASNSNDIDNNLLLKNSVVKNINYRDIVSSIRFENDHIPATITISGTNRNSSVSTSVPKFLHGTEKEVFIRSVMKDVTAGGRDDLLLDLRSKRFLLYTLKTALENIDTELLSDINLITPELLGDISSDFLTVLEYSRNENSTTIKVSDLLGL